MRRQIDVRGGDEFFVFQKREVVWEVWRRRGNKVGKVWPRKFEEACIDAFGKGAREFAAKLQAIADRMAES